MAKETWAVKLDEQMKTRLAELSKNYDSGEAMMADLVATKELAANVEMPSKARPEITALAKTFSGVLERVQAIAVLAEAERNQAAEAVLAIKEQARTEVEELRSRIREAETQANNALEKAVELTAEIAAAKEQHESVSALKAAWSEKEAELTSRLAELDTEAKMARDLATKLSEVRQTLSTKEAALVDERHKTALALKDAALAQEKAVAEAKEHAEEMFTAKLKESNEKVDGLQAQLQQAERNYTTGVSRAQEEATKVTQAAQTRISTLEKEAAVSTEKAAGLSTQVAYLLQQISEIKKAH